MKTALHVLENIHIASPCEVAWERMPGTERVRHCSECNQSVYDISSLSAHEAIRLLEDSGGNVCVRLYRRADGKVLTRDCAAVRAVQRLRLVVYRAGFAVASFFGFAFAIVGCGEQSRCFSGSGSGHTMGKPVTSSRMDQEMPANEGGEIEK